MGQPARTAVADGKAKSENGRYNDAPSRTLAWSLTNSHRRPRPPDPSPRVCKRAVPARPIGRRRTGSARDRVAKAIVRVIAHVLVALDCRPRLLAKPLNSPALYRTSPLDRPNRDCARWRPSLLRWKRPHASKF